MKPKHSIKSRDEFHIRFLFYRLGMGAPSIALILRIPVGLVEKYCKDLPTNKRRREIQLRTRYAGKHRHYEKKTPRLSAAAAEALYQTTGLKYDNVRPSDLLEPPSDDPDPLDTMIAALNSRGTSCGTTGDGRVIVGSDTVTQHRLSAIVMSIYARNRCRVG